MADLLDLLMFVSLFAVILSGFPVAFCLGGVALAFALIGWTLGVFDLRFIAFLPQRVFGVMTNEVLLAVPLFILMGTLLERTRVAEDLLTAMAAVFGRVRGGLALSITAVGALLAASTGIVGATVVTMGLISLPTMLARGYDPRLAAGSICAAGTLGQIIPPSIVLVVLGDVMANAHQAALLEQGVFAPDTMTVGDLFAGALLPGLLLVGLYMAYQAWVAWHRPEAAPALPPEVAGSIGPPALIRALVPPLLLIIAVLGAILGGLATPTEAAGVGAVGALLLGAVRTGPQRWQRRMALIGGFSLVVLVALAGSGWADLRLGRTVEGDAPGLVAVALGLAGIGAAGVLAAVSALMRAGTLTSALQSTGTVTAMIFTIVIGAALFSLVFRGLGGDESIRTILESLPGGATGALWAVMLVMFVLGFFLDFLEITFVVVPVVAPILLLMGIDPVWLAVLMAINLQTSFLTPPFGFALFYLRGVAPAVLSTADLYRGAVPFVILQLVGLGLVAAFPMLATALPDRLYP